MPIENYKLENRTSHQVNDEVANSLKQQAFQLSNVFNGFPLMLLAVWYHKHYCKQQFVIDPMIIYSYGLISSKYDTPPPNERARFQLIVCKLNLFIDSNRMRLRY